MPNRRAERLFAIVQFLRGGRTRTAQAIADELEVSVRSVYRDLDALAAGGVPILGRRGVGFRLAEPILLPPMTLTAEEFEALRLGADLVALHADARLASAASEVVVKLEAVTPASRRERVAFRSHTVHARPADPPKRLDLMRAAIRDRVRMRLRYTDADGCESARTVRPLQLEFWGSAWTLAAWCEERADFRHFRLDRITAAEPTGDTFLAEEARSYAELLRRYQAAKPPPS